MSKQALEGFDEMVGCLEYGEGWSWTLAATPDGQSQLLGHDDRRYEVWTRRYGCVAGHWYHVETPAPNAGEVNDAGDLGILGVCASTS
jgi:hypothetical protein